MVLTRSARQAQQPRLPAASIPDTPQVEQDERPKKRVKTRRGGEVTKVIKDPDIGFSSGAVGKSARKKRKLDILGSMPLEMFCEIARYLDPGDLLRLSRSSKALHELLVSKSARLLWRTAEETVGLPKCPQDLSSPQYAAFIFGKLCTYCVNARAIKRGLELMSEREIENKYGGKAEIFFLVPTRDYTEIFEKEKPAEISFRSYKYYEPEFKTILEKYNSFKKSSVDQKNFVNERREAVYKIGLESKKLLSWLHRANNLKSKDKADAISNRQSSIHAKLRDLGYSDEDFDNELDNEKWRWNDLIKQPRVLTDRSTFNAILSLEETIRLRRENIVRIAKERRISERQNKLIDFVWKFVSSDEGKTCCIIASDFLVLPSVQEVINNDEAGTDIPQKHFDSLKQKVLELSETRIQKIKVKVASSIMRTRLESGLQVISTNKSSEDIIRGALNYVDSSVTLQHPTSFIGKRFDFHFNHLFTFPVMMKTLRSCSLRCFQLSHCGYIASMESFRGMPDQSALSIADALYASVDVASTLADMEALRDSFVCMRCSPSARKLLSWGELVNHFYQERLGFLRRERERENGEKTVSLINIHDHDEKMPGKLAVYTGNTQQSRKDLIKPCDCRSKHTGRVKKIMPYLRDS
ncbi:hypothetical protein EW145_g7058 [Phellinidium pouzarii]|uniref:F-box domain-containing protein n=1 Tax=Phellinidium pouzarii TaxID=167371 RepID=A0A4S4KPR0_9AGAM|nr:hypothetical protein EW145_g7058 [Phellinidium pouzarii]